MISMSLVEAGGGMRMRLNLLPTNSAFVLRVELLLLRVMFMLSLTLVAVILIVCLWCVVVLMWSVLAGIRL